VLEGHIASIFKVKEHVKHETNMKVLLVTSFNTGFMLGSFFNPEDECDLFL
jgi:hypothetical protein